MSNDIDDNMSLEDAEIVRYTKQRRAHLLSSSDDDDLEKQNGIFSKPFCKNKEYSNNLIDEQENRNFENEVEITDGELLPVEVNISNEVGPLSDEEESNLLRSKGDLNLQSKGPVFKSKLLTSSDMESDEEGSCCETKKQKSVRETLVHSQSYSENDSDEGPIAKNYKKDNKSDKEKKQKKKTRTVVDEKLAIRSETQRMEREIPINLPYHRPKQRSLREFLSRKKNALKAECLRSTSATMIQTWEGIYKSIKETADFFKSESEEEPDGSETAKLNGTKISEETYEIDNIENGKQAHKLNPTGIVEEQHGVGDSDNANQQDHDAGEESQQSCPAILSTPMDNAHSSGIHSISSFPKDHAVNDSNQKNDCFAPIVDHSLDCGNDRLEVEPEISNQLIQSGGKDSHVTRTSEKFILPNIEISCNDRTTDLNEKSNSELSGIAEYSSKEKTGKWLEDIVMFEKRESIKNKLQLSPSILNIVPTLSIDEDTFVELSVKSSLPSELKSGARQLMERMFKCRQQRFRGPVSLTTTTAERDASGQIKNISVETLPLTPAPDVQMDSTKPGMKLQILREKLRNEIEAKWEDGFMKRCPIPTGKPDFEENAESTDEVEDDFSCESESEPEEDDIKIRDKPKKFCDFLDSEAEESSVDGAESDGEDGDDESEDCDAKEDDDETHNSTNKPGHGEKKDVEELECSLLPAFQPGGGLLMGGSVLTQQTQPLPLSLFSPTTSPAVEKSKILRTPVAVFGRTSNTPHGTKTPLTVNEPRETQIGGDSMGAKKNLFGVNDTTPGRHNLFLDSGPDDGDDPFLFVSGAFPEGALTPLRTEASGQFKPKRIILSQGSDDSRGFEGTDGLTLASDKEEAEENRTTLELDEKKCEIREKTSAAEVVEETITLTKKQKKKLAFSDEETDEENGAENDKDTSPPAEKKNDRSPEKDDIDEAELSEEAGQHEEVCYDSEENEVAAVRPGEFLEREAELSESEWSGDEDERGLDELEAEAGDADVLDEDQVASQLGRIHMRRLLDEDARDVRLLKELLFEDGDLHSDGKGRDRKFRWKNLSGFDLTGVANGDDGGSDGEGDEGDGELAKMRHEKAQFFLQLEQEGKLDRIEEEFSQGGNSLVQFGHQLLQRLNPRPPTTDVTKTSRSRGSFLCKDAAFLSRLARVASGGNDTPLGPAHSKNFVFAVQDKKEISEEVSVVKEGVKRKAVVHQETVKRVKLAAKLGGQPSILDQIL